ncbi:selenium cofactor biosynthesis protein YqeC [Acetohalobium arabaticum]|uniref:Selenium-dependent hydroxylase accessory protein YqeC n=1 Tax=Acetohalobium arabaticum (strain ATCC 49924 / DSM 5501 / Z-7288) TaxID=574087 RepID=D9QUW1_ACEAZ|nr:selenium cofactor biosynthesis protein YqeC [Acetohalobium arabaticum]ADL12020.1 conserved hypothetical protein [Acetohalobium arabaticum DSM 5501]
MLAEVLGIRFGAAISLIGGGGKTTTMFRLAEELSLENRVITTTTTKIFKPPTNKIDDLIICKDFDLLLERLELSQAQLLTVAKKITVKDKLIGIDSCWVDKLKGAGLSYAPIIIVEADGAACKDFKIPNQTEPVVPVSTNLLLPVVGSRLVGQQLNSHNLHRASLINTINSQFDIGQLITPELVVEILLGKAGYDLLTKQQNYEVIPLINQVDTDPRYNFALEIAHKLVAAGIKKVLLTAVKRKEPVVGVVKR